MSSKAMTLSRWDSTRYLTDEDAIADYLEAVLEQNDDALLLVALGNIAKARGMTAVAREAGLGRESLYKALSPDGNPRFDTVMKVARALGIRLVPQVVEKAV
jgi:probable addiction module antidote protein